MEGDHIGLVMSRCEACGGKCNGDRVCTLTNSNMKVSAAFILFSGSGGATFLPIKLHVCRMYNTFVLS